MATSLFCGVCFTTNQHVHRLCITCSRSDLSGAGAYNLQSVNNQWDIVVYNGEVNKNVDAKYSVVSSTSVVHQYYCILLHTDAQLSGTLVVDVEAKTDSIEVFWSIFNGANSGVNITYEVSQLCLSVCLSVCTSSSNVCGYCTVP